MEPNMTLSQQATGRQFPRADAYPFRVMVWEARGEDWTLTEIFEWETLAGAELAGLETCTEPYPAGVTAMHYYVGEVA